MLNDSPGSKVEFVKKESAHDMSHWQYGRSVVVLGCRAGSARDVKRIRRVRKGVVSVSRGVHESVAYTGWVDGWEQL